MHPPKLFLLFFVGACFSGIGFTYCLYYHQARAYPLASQIKALEVSAEDPKLKALLATAIPEVLPSERALQKDLQVQYTKNKPVRRLNKLSHRLDSAKQQKEVLQIELAFSQKACQALEAYLGQEKALDPVMEKLSTNTLSSLVGKTDQAQSKIEQLEPVHTQLEEELDELQLHFTKA